MSHGSSSVNTVTNLRDLNADAAVIQGILLEAKDRNPAITLLSVDKELSRLLAFIAKLAM